MAKLTKVAQKLFGSTANAGEIGEFGSFAAGSFVASTDPTAIQSLSNFLGGWFQAIVGANAPTIEDMNALFFLAFRQIAYSYQAGIAEWDAGTIYFKGSLVNDGNGNIYRSVTDTNTNNAVTDNTNWVSYYGYAIRAVAVDFTVGLSDYIIEVDATGALRTGTVPAASSTNKGQKVTVVKSDSSGNPVVVGTYGNLAGQYDNMTLFSNGTVWYQI